MKKIQKMSRLIKKIRRSLFKSSSSQKIKSSSLFRSQLRRSEEAQINNKSKQLLDMDKNSTIDEKIDYAKQTINELNINQNDISNIETSIKIIVI